MGAQVKPFKTIISLAVLFQLALAHCMAQSPAPASKFIIVTRDRFGFQKDRDFYTLGTKLEESLCEPGDLFGQKHYPRILPPSPQGTPR